MSSPWAQRRQGLSSRQNPSGLLKNIQGRRKDGIDLLDDSPSAMPSKSEEVDEADFNRPPDLSSDSEDDRHKHADIAPTQFRPGSTSNQPSSARTRETRLSANDASQKSQDEKQPLGGTKRAGEEISGSHLTDARGFSKKPKVKNTFGKSAQRMRVPNRGYSKKDTTGSAKGFKHTPINSSPLSSPSKSKFKRPGTLDSSPEKGKKGFVKNDISSEEDSPQQRRAPKKTRNGKEQHDKNSSKEDEEPVESSPVHKFKTHYLDDLDDLNDVPDDDSRAPLNTQQVKSLMDSDNALDSDSELSSLDSMDDDLFLEPRCPMCDDPVELDLLKQHTKNGKMNIRKQTAFCRMHKRRDAEIARKTKGYPAIDWTSLEPRMEKLEEYIRDILEGKHTSYYAGILSERVEAGENRTLLRTEESLIPGYYGPRGLRVLTDYIMKEFSDTVRKRAVEDRLVSSRGYTGYVQAVLVPEMAVRLIMEDMNVEEDDARQILSESRDVGELMNEETKDIVRWTQEEHQHER